MGTPSGAADTADAAAAASFPVALAAAGTADAAGPVAASPVALPLATRHGAADEMERRSRVLLCKEAARSSPGSSGSLTPSPVGAPPPLAARVWGPASQAQTAEHRWRLLLKTETALEQDRAALTGAQEAHAAAVRAFEAMRSRDQLLRDECLRERDKLRQELQDRADASFRSERGQALVQLGALQEALRRETKRREELEAELEVLRRQQRW